MQKCFDQGSSLSLPEPTIPSTPEQERPSGREETASVELSFRGDDTKTPNTDNTPSAPQVPALGPKTEEKGANSIPPTLPTQSQETPEEPCKPRVLVVEDNKINLNLMLAFLKKRALVTLDSAENGRLAVSAVEKLQESYDIIFMGKSVSLFSR
jgi:hypothetical protein